MIDCNLIDSNPSNTRPDPKKDAGLPGLAESITRIGLLQPIGVTIAEGGRYTAAFGNRRLAAWKMNAESGGPAEIQCRIVNPAYTEGAMIDENRWREPMTPIGEIKLILAQAERTGDIEEAGRILGMTAARVRQAHKVKNLSKRMWEIINSIPGGVTMDEILSIGKMSPGFKAEIEAEGRWWVLRDYLRKDHQKNRDPNNAPWGMDAVLGKLPTCRGCPFLNTNPDLFEEGETAQCENPGCWQAKEGIHLSSTLPENAVIEEGSGMDHLDRPKKDVDKWEAAKKNDPNAVPVVTGMSKNGKPTIKYKAPPKGKGVSAKEKKPDERTTEEKDLIRLDKLAANIRKAILPKFDDQVEDLQVEIRAKALRDYVLNVPRVIRLAAYHSYTEYLKPFKIDTVGNQQAMVEKIYCDAIAQRTRQSISAISTLETVQRAYKAFYDWMVEEMTIIEEDPDGKKVELYGIIWLKAACMEVLNGLSDKQKDLIARAGDSSWIWKGSNTPTKLKK